MPFVAPDAVTWLADWDAGHPVTFVDPAPDRRIRTVEEIAGLAAEALRMLIARDPDPSTWAVKAVWLQEKLEIWEGLAPAYADWSLSDAAWAGDCGSTLYAYGLTEWETNDVDALVQVSKL